MSINAGLLFSYGIPTIALFAVLYFIDTGLMCHLLRLRSPEDLAGYPLYGAIFETFVASELLKSFTHCGERPPLYYWRDRTWHEVDV